MATQKQVAHIDETVGLMIVNASGRDKIVYGLWGRAIIEHGLEPITSHNPHIVPQESWYEAFATTRAAGTCIAASEPLTVHQSDYLEAANISPACKNGPIFDFAVDRAAKRNIKRFMGGGN